jgi:hypothetical protein
VSAPQDGSHLERGGSWRPFWRATGVLAVLLVLGGGWSVPKGRTGLPLRRTDGTTVLVPTRAPAQLTEAFRTSHPARDAGTGRPGRVDP